MPQRANTSEFCRRSRRVCSTSRRGRPQQQRCINTPASAFPTSIGAQFSRTVAMCRPSNKRSLEEQQWLHPREVSFTSNTKVHIAAKRKCASQLNFYCSERQLAPQYGNSTAATANSRLSMYFSFFRWMFRARRQPSNPTSCTWPTT